MSDGSPGNGRTARPVLLVGNGGPGEIGGYFARALCALGYRCFFIDESRHFAPPKTRWLGRALDRAMLRPVEIRRFNELIARRAAESRPAVVIVVSGRHIQRATLQRVRDTGARLVAFATDNPLVPGRSRDNLRECFAEYDVYASPRRSSLAALGAAGCRRPVHIRFGYEPGVHYAQSPAEPRWSSDVVFIGGADEDRVRMFEPLAAGNGLVMRLYGRGWGRTPLERHAGGEIFEHEFRFAMTGAKVAPCLVRRSNADGHVMRSFEIPACRQFMLAERTEEHLELFEDGVHAAYFDGPDELRDKALYYLRHPSERERMARACHDLVTSGHHTYRDRVREMMSMDALN